MLRVSSQAGLASVTDLLHDRWFDVGTLRSGPGEHAMSITFPSGAGRSRALSAMREILGMPQSAETLLLTIHAVDAFILEEPEGIALYPLNLIRYDSERGRVALESDIPVRVEFEVHRLCLEVSSAPTR